LPGCPPGCVPVEMKWVLKSTFFCEPHRKYENALSCNWWSKSSKFFKDLPSQAQKIAVDFRTGISCSARSQSRLGPQKNVSSSVASHARVLNKSKTGACVALTPNKNCVFYSLWKFSLQSVYKNNGTSTNDLNHWFCVLQPHQTCQVLFNRSNVPPDLTHTMRSFCKTPLT